MRLTKIKLYFVVILLIAISSCNYNSNVMMKTGKEYNFDAPPSDKKKDYVISVSDLIEFKLYTNNGSMLVDLTAINEGNRGIPRQISPQYVVEFNGTARFPIIDTVNVVGKTERELEKYLEEKYSQYYIKPFVQVRIVNKRVTVFPGGSGQAKVVPLTNNNMRLIEALGAVGGLTRLAKAKRIKLIRGDLKDPEVFLFNFRTLEGLQESDFVLQANDIIYVEPRSDYFQELVRDIAPVIGLITSTITLMIVLNNQAKN